MRKLVLFFIILSCFSGCARPVQETAKPTNNTSQVDSTQLQEIPAQPETNATTPEMVSPGQILPETGLKKLPTGHEKSVEKTVQTPQKPVQKPEQAAKKSTGASFMQIPKGPLDDAKYIAISVKYTTALLNLPPAKQTDSELMRQMLSQVLKEANITSDEFARYTERIAENESRKERVTDAIMQLVEKQAKAKLREKPEAKVGELQVLGKMEEKDLPEGKASKH